MDPFGASAALHGLAPSGHISSAHRARNDRARVGMNVTAHQEKEENEETKKGKRGAGENKRPILKKLCAALLRSFRGQHSVPGVTGTLGKATSHFDQTQTGSGTAPPR